jgi:hypothetical protein
VKVKFKSRVDLLSHIALRPNTLLARLYVYVSTQRASEAGTQRPAAPPRVRRQDQRAYFTRAALHRIEFPARRRALARGAFVSSVCVSVRRWGF